MGKLRNWFATRTGIIVTGAVIGVLATLLEKFGNPPNMGICVACFSRDISGALGLHRAAVVQYLRPEIPGLILGALIASLMFGEFKARAGSAPMVRFLLGAFAMIGALVFLGCPWRTMLRIAGGDVNALVGVAGLILGIFIATRFFMSGYNPGASKATFPAVGLIFPALAIGLLLLVFAFPPVAEQAQSGVLFYSVKGPGAMHAPILMSLGVGVVIGWLLQRSRFCTVGGFRDLILFRQTHLISGILALIVSAFIMNLVLQQFKFGIEGQPIAHTSAVWNFLGMVLAGMAFTMAGACPGRQCVLAGEGDADSAMFVCGMLVGAGFAHNFSLAASPKGVGVNGQIAVIVGILVCCALGFFMREKSPT
jgi:YedE family putative selenium metabolism protein